jgi:hypothetical protein
MNVHTHMCILCCDLLQHAFVFVHCRRNFVLTGCSLFHASFMNEYTHSQLPFMIRGREIVDEIFNGEDILFSFMHAKLTGLRCACYLKVALLQNVNVECF